MDKFFADSLRYCVMREGGADGHFWCGGGHQSKLFGLLLYLPRGAPLRLLVNNPLIAYKSLAVYSDRRKFLNVLL